MAGTCGDFDGLGMSFETYPVTEAECDRMLKNVRNHEERMQIIKFNKIVGKTLKKIEKLNKKTPGLRAAAQYNRLFVKLEKFKKMRDKIMLG